MPLRRRLTSRRPSNTRGLTIATISTSTGGTGQLQFSRDYSRRSRFLSLIKNNDKDGDRKYDFGVQRRRGGNKGSYGKWKFNKFKGMNSNKKFGSDKIF